MVHINQIACDPSIKRHVHYVCINIDIRLNMCSLGIKISSKLVQTEAKLGLTEANFGLNLIIFIFKMSGNINFGVT